MFLVSDDHLTVDKGGQLHNHLADARAKVNNSVFSSNLGVFDYRNYGIETCFSVNLCRKEKLVKKIFFLEMLKANLNPAVVA